MIPSQVSRSHSIIYLEEKIALEILYTGHSCPVRNSIFGAIPEAQLQIPRRAQLEFEHYAVLMLRTQVHVCNRYDGRLGLISVKLMDIDRSAEAGPQLRPRRVWWIYLIEC